MMKPGRTNAGEGGQSATTREWVARRDAAAEASAMVQERNREERDVERLQIEQENTGGNPLLFLFGFFVVFLVLAAASWFFVERAQCDPMISDRGMSSACRGAP
jgi:hypothetical protein